MPIIRVYVLTTLGPSAIVYLGPESATSGVRSAIRIDGAVKPARISAQYEPFVDVFVQRASEHRVYRMDVSHPIDDGESWQLGFLVAHRILDHPRLRLAVDDEPADIGLFVSGKLHDRPAAGRIDVRSVNGIAEKMDHARAQIAGARPGQQHHLILPYANTSEIEAASHSQDPWEQPLLAEEFATVEAFLDTLAVGAGSDQAGVEDPRASSESKASRNHGFRPFVIAAVLVVLAVAGLAALVRFDPFHTVSAPSSGGAASDDTKRKRIVGDATAVMMSLSVVEAEDGRRCDDADALRSRALDVNSVDNGSVPQTIVRAASGRRVCGFSIEVRNRAEIEIDLNGSLRRAVGRVQGGNWQIEATARQVVASGSAATVSFRLPRFRLDKERYRLEVAQGEPVNNVTVNPVIWQISLE